MFSAFDHQMMARALRLAARGRFWARPNPHVGCVLTRAEQVLGEGFTQPAGDDHAEVVALRAAGGAARGATAYVTLEPCAHQGRTPPCVSALISAGVSRVVCAVKDPNPRVNGGGIAALRAAGISVDTGLASAEVERQLAGFLARQRRGRGRLRAKLAMSLDGRTAMASGESQWITGPAARRDVQRLRAESCAILTGVGTVLADNCALTVRDESFARAESAAALPPPARRALRVVADSRLRTPPTAAVLAGEQPSLLLHDENSVLPDSLRSIPVQGLPMLDGALDPRALLDALGARECNEILLESGPTLAGALLREGLLDELIVYIAPRLLGSRARPLFELPLDEMAEVLDLRLVDQRRVGNDQKLVFLPHDEPRPPAGSDAHNAE
jgi:diaminohydroxyphosphoribosylaminopyrimidine deaminase/5-amino-6-(5-phosphoribosylamino)uracil reductase